MQVTAERSRASRRPPERLIAEFEGHWDELVRFLTSRKLRSSLLRGPAGDLSQVQLAALTGLAREELRMSDLAAWLGISESATTRLVDRLERQGLVERTAYRSDRRCVVAGLTPEGRHLIDQVREERRHVLKDILHALPVSERAELVRLFGRIADEFRAREEESTS